MSGASLAVKRTIAEQQQTKPVVTRSTAQATDIQNNPVAKIMLSESLSPEQKCEEVKKFLVATDNKEEMKRRVAAFAEFEEYLQSVREQMSQEIIKLTDTETFSELQACYEDLNTSLTEFDDRLKPLTDIVDAVYTLRMNDKTLEAFKEIQEDRKDEEKRKQLRENIANEVTGLEDQSGNINNEISRLGQEKSWFGWGAVTQNARKEIAVKVNDLEKIQAQVADLQHQLSDLDSQGNRSSALAEFAEQKAKLRELLDISSEEHKERQKALVDAALKFVSVAKGRIGSVRGHLGQMNDQIDRLYDANSRVTNVYATLAEGIKEAETENEKIRQTLNPPTGDENALAKMSREDKKTAVEDHIRMLGARGADTIETYADLTSQTIRIKTMRDANQAQMDKARAMHTQGVAGVADRLSVVLQAVSSAALGESSEMAKGTLARMVASTGAIAQKESIRLAMGVHESNSDVLKAIEDLSSWGEVTKQSTDLTRSGLTEMRENLAKIKQLAQDVQGDIHEATAVHADVAAQVAPPTAANGDARPLGI